MEGNAGCGCHTVEVARIRPEENFILLAHLLKQPIRREQMKYTKGKQNTNKEEIQIYLNLNPIVLF